MIGNTDLNNARKAKNDEFYTRYADIKNELLAYYDYNKDVFRGKTVLLPCDDPELSNFTKFFTVNLELFGIKKLISTSYSNSGNGKISVNGSEWQYLQGNGDFRSEEVTKLRDEADIIITNPPFSLFREFMAWIVEADKHFVIMGNMNAITFKNVFPLIKNGKIWLGHSLKNGDCIFEVPIDYVTRSPSVRVENGKKFLRVSGIRWFANLDHGIRRKPLKLMTMEDNLKYSKHKKVREAYCYQKYDNYDAIEVPFTDAIPSDYDGVMGVPISFLGKYCPEQFEILGISEQCGKGFSNGLWDELSKITQPIVDKEKIYNRLFIRHRKDESNE